MKAILIATFFLVHSSAITQRVITPTDSLLITGEVQQPVTYTLAELDSFTSSAIGDLVIVNHRGEAKDTLTGLKGVPLKMLLEKIEYRIEKPKELNEFYFVFTASDGYKVVFSWNEVFNTPSGNQFFVVTFLENKTLKEMDQRIMFISPADIQTGRRYIKGLQKIEVKRTE